MRLVRVAVNVEQLLYRTPGGVGRYTAKLVTLLAPLFPDDDIVTFVAYHRQGDIERACRAFGLDLAGLARPVRLPFPRPLLYDSWHLLDAPGPGWFSPLLGSADLIHAPSVAVPPRGRGRLVVSIHDLAHLLHPETYPRRGRWFHARGIRAATERADMVITGSQSAADEINGCTSIPSERVRVVPYGVDPTVASPDAIRSTLARHHLSEARYVLWVGSLEPRKNVSTLVRAFARLVASAAVPHLLVLAGPSGWLVKGLIPEPERRLLGDRLRVLGWVGDDELAALYGGAEVFALPSLHEGFGLPALEAMVQGTPVVCGDIPALREVSGGAARLVPARDTGGWVAALEDLLGDSAARDTLAKAGRQRAAAFSWERTARETHAVYAELVGS